MVEKRYRVFISSVQKELETERIAVAGGVSIDNQLGRYCEIILFEKEPLSGRKVVKPYLECLGTCDIYILILDREYGKPLGIISATHEEYRYAQSRAMPMMILVRGDYDSDRKRETQDFFAEIKRDGHVYRRFHDRLDLLPEIKRGLHRILRESFGMPIEDSLETTIEAGRASMFEQQILSIPEDDLDLDLAMAWLKATDYSFDEEKPDKRAVLNALRERGLVLKTGKGFNYTAVASGLLFLGKNPSTRFPQCRILMDAYSGVEPDPNPRDQLTLSGPAPHIVERAVGFVAANTRHPIRVAGINRIKLDEYPSEVIREAIVNAIAHRDYEDASRPIYLKVFFDRAEVLSPGNLVPPLTIAKLNRGNYEPCSRNPMLAQYLTHMSLMEQRGSGIRRMHSIMVDHGLEPPEYSFKDGYFRVLLKGPAEKVDRLKVPSSVGISAAIEERLTERQRKMAELLASGEVLTSGYCQKEFGISGVTVVQDLATLVDLGIAERIGKGRGTRYIFRGAIVKES